MLENFVIGFVIAILTYALYKLFEVVNPLSKAKQKTDKSFEYLKEKYDLVYREQFVIFLMVAVPLSFVLYFIFSFLISIRLSVFNEAAFVIKPSNDFVGALALLAGLLLSVIISFNSTKRHLHDDWEEYLAYLNLNYKFEYLKSISVFLCFPTLLILVGVVIAFDWYTVFDKSDIRINGFFSLGSKTYQYTEIVKIEDVQQYEALSGDIYDRPHFVIRFVDGEEWNSQESGFANYQNDKKIIDMILAKTNLEPVKIELNER